MLKKMLKATSRLVPLLALSPLFMMARGAEAQLSNYDYSPVVDGYLAEYLLTEPPFLKPGGIEGEAVQDIQILLDELGYYNGNIDGFYDPALANAVEDLQIDYGLEATGTLTPETWDLLFSFDLDEIYEDGDYFIEASGTYNDVEDSIIE